MLKFRNRSIVILLYSWLTQTTLGWITEKRSVRTFIHPMPIHKCSQSTSFMDDVEAFPWVLPAELAWPIFPEVFWSRGWTIVALISVFGRNWLDIQSSTNFIAAHFVAKCHTVGSSQKFHLFRLRKHSFSHCQRFMTIGEVRNKDWFKIWQLCVVWKLPLRPHSDEAHSAFVPPTSLFRLSSLVNTTSKYLNFCTCCSVMPIIVACMALPWVSKET